MYLILIEKAEDLQSEYLKGHLQEFQQDHSDKSSSNESMGEKAFRAIK